MQKFKQEAHEKCSKEAEIFSFYLLESSSVYTTSRDLLSLRI